MGNSDSSDAARRRMPSEVSTSQVLRVADPVETRIGFFVAWTELAGSALATMRG
jgi:hypothetical protein